MPTYSHSRLETYENCPRRYKLQYIDRIPVPEEKGIEAFMGGVVHEALEGLYRDIKMCRPPSLEAVLQRYDEIWDKGSTDSIFINDKRYTKDDYRNTGKKCIEKYYARFAPFDKSTALWLEERVSFEIGPVKLQGYVDRLDRTASGEYEIHDYKTGGRLPSQQDMDTSRQLALYEIAVRKIWKDVKAVRLIWHYMQFDTDIVSVKTQDQLKQLEKDICVLVQKIEADETFAPAPSRLCDWCPYWEHCPEKRHMAKIGKMGPAKAKKENGYRLVNEYAKLKEKEKAIQEKIDSIRTRIISYAKTEKLANIRGEESVVTVNVSKSLSLPSKSSDAEKYGLVEKMVKDAGLWDEYSVLDGRRLSGDMEREKLDKSLQKKLEQFAQEKTTETLRLSKIKEEE